MTAAKLVVNPPDDYAARGRELNRLASIEWYAAEIIREADDLFKLYGPPPGPGDRVTAYLHMVRHFVEALTPETPGGGVDASGKDAAPPLGPGVDVHVEDDISGAFADLKLTDDEDGRP